VRRPVEKVCFMLYCYSCFMSDYAVFGIYWMFWKRAVSRKPVNPELPECDVLLSIFVK